MVLFLMKIWWKNYQFLNHFFTTFHHLFNQVKSFCSSSFQTILMEWCWLAGWLAGWLVSCLGGGLVGWVNKRLWKPQTQGRNPVGETQREEPKRRTQSAKRCRVLLSFHPPRSGITSMSFKNRLSHNFFVDFLRRFNPPRCFRHPPARTMRTLGPNPFRKKKDPHTRTHARRHVHAHTCTCVCASIHVMCVCPCAWPCTHTDTHTGTKRHAKTQHMQTHVRLDW